MAQKINYILFGFLLIFSLSCKEVRKEVPTDTKSQVDKKEWISLFNGTDLKDWDTYLGPKYNESQRDFIGEHIGFNNDPDAVFSVVSIGGKPAIRISGQHFGAVTTKDEFENYHLQLQFKWGEKRWVPRTNSKRDSGILYHSVGEQAKGWFFWMVSEEFQIQEGDSGDYWGVGGSMVDAPATENSEGEYIYNPNGTILVFGGTRDKADERASGRLIKSNDEEKPTGEWNTVDLYCYGNKSIYYVNNIETVRLYNLRKPDGSPLTKGKIQLQSEGAEIYYRNIKVEPISQLPTNL